MRHLEVTFSVGLLFWVTVLCLMDAFGLTPAAQAQVSHCGGFTSIEAFTQPIYPPIAKAAHVEGIVIFLLSFDRHGMVEAVQPVSGPPMLLSSATTSVKTLKVNSYTGPRTCPFIVQYRLAPDGEETAPKPPDIQHVIVTALNIVLSDPAIYHRRRVLGIF